jgi:iron complex outermembrane recepter protein
MKCRVFLVLGTALPAMLTSPAMAQSSVSDSGEESRSTDIIVTARRQLESLQDVPQTVNAVTGETIEKLNIQEFQDIETLVPGLTLVDAGNGFGTAASVRGATFNVETGAKDTVVFYQNEVVIQPSILFNNMFDIGQIEVLRGPQGTVRGRSAPSGAITVTTRRPDLQELGGEANLTVTEDGNVNGKFAIGAPFIEDVLAFRIAGVIDNNDFGDVRSINSSVEPYSKTAAGRISLRFEPTSSIRANVMYQYMDVKTRRFTAVFGPGSPGGIVPGYSFGPFPYPARPAPPAGYNGPPIAPGDRLAVMEDPVNIHQVFQVLTGNIEFDLGGHRLSYIGGWSKQSTDSFGGGDTFNMHPGGNELSQVLNNVNQYTSHELRISSIERIAGMFDYTAGVFYLNEKNSLDTRQRSANPGVYGGVFPGPFPFGLPGMPQAVPQPLRAPDPAYIMTVAIRGLGNTKELSFYGSVTAHLGESTEITGGLRYIDWKERPRGPFLGDVPASELFGNGTSLCLSPGLTLLPFPIPGLGNVLPGQFRCLDGATRPTVDSNAWVWNISASHRFNDDIMAYATVGTSWRAGPFSVAPHELEADPSLGLASANDLRFHDNERSTSYEIGLKTSFLDNKGRFNIAVYYQEFKDYFFFSNDTRRLGLSGGIPNGTVGDFNYTANADAKVKGVDIDAAYQITPNWDISAAFSWAKGNVDNDEVPCNDGNFDGVADTIVPTAQDFIDAGVIVARCVSNESISRSPRWNLALRSEYGHPIAADMDAFLRGQFTYYPSNRFQTPLMKIDSYGLLNLYAGLRAADGMWEVNVFAKNVLNERQLLDVSPANPHREYGEPGYQTFSFTQRREFGINVRYAFGSR